MQATLPASTPTPAQRYAKTIEVSKRIRWDIDRDIIRGREFDLKQKFLPDGLSLIDELDFLSPTQQRFLSQVQGRTYANMFGLVERFIGAKMLEVSRDHWLGDQTALEAIVRFTDEELKHQELFRRIERMVGRPCRPATASTSRRTTSPSFVLGKSTWAVLALTCHIELFSQAHYRASIASAEGLSPTCSRTSSCSTGRRSRSTRSSTSSNGCARTRKLASDAERDAAVEDLIALVGGVDGILQGQAKADAAYFLAVASCPPRAQASRIEAALLKAYRWQYIVSGTLEPRFQHVLGELVSDRQMARIQEALGPLTYAMPAPSKAEVATTH